MASVGGAPIYWGTAYANNAKYVYLGSAYADNAKPVYESPAGGSPVCIGTAYANNASPVYIASCFPRSTLVHTKNGEYVPIGFLKEGDSILSWNIEQNKATFGAITKVHAYRGYEINGFNNDFCVSPTHPLLIMKCDEDGFFAKLIWKLARDINAGDFFIDFAGKPTEVRSKSYRWIDKSIEVINLSTDSGLPFIAGGCVARANNAVDNLEFTSTKMPIAVQTLAA